MIYSVAFGCAGPAATTQTIRRSPSGQYQIRPPAVTSYCHCSSVRLPIWRLPNWPRSRCCRAGFSGCAGRSVSTTHASHVLARATRQSSSHPFAAADVAKRASQPSGRDGRRASPATVRPRPAPEPARSLRRAAGPARRRVLGPYGSRRWPSTRREPAPGPPTGPTRQTPGRHGRSRW